MGDFKNSKTAREDRKAIYKYLEEHAQERMRKLMSKEIIVPKCGVCGCNMVEIPLGYFCMVCDINNHKRKKEGDNG